MQLIMSVHKTYTNASFVFVIYSGFTPKFVILNYKFKIDLQIACGDPKNLHMCEG